MEDTPCFVTFSLRLRRSFFSPLRSYQMMHMPDVEVAVVEEEAFMGVACAPEDFMEAGAVVPFTPGAFMVVAVTTRPDVLDQVTR